MKIERENIATRSWEILLFFPLKHAKNFLSCYIGE
jgi:hypothetical protein